MRMEVVGRLIDDVVERADLAVCVLGGNPHLLEGRVVARVEIGGEMRKGPVDLVDVDAHLVGHHRPGRRRGRVALEDLGRAEEVDVSLLEAVERGEALLDRLEGREQIGVSSDRLEASAEPVERRAVLFGLLRRLLMRLTKRRERSLDAGQAGKDPVGLRFDNDLQLRLVQSVLLGGYGADALLVLEDGPNIGDRLKVMRAELGERPAELAGEGEVLDERYEVGELSWVVELVSSEVGPEGFSKGPSFSGSSSRMFSLPATSSSRKL
jgi:hypothetical protein